MNVRLRRALYTASGRRYLAGEILTVVGEWKGKLDLDGPQGKLYRVPPEAVEGLAAPRAAPRAVPPRSIPIGSVEVPHRG